MTGIHPTMPGEQDFQSVPHDEDDGDPQPRTNQYTSHHTLAVLRQVSTAGPATRAQHHRLYETIGLQPLLVFGSS